MVENSPGLIILKVAQKVRQKASKPTVSSSRNTKIFIFGPMVGKELPKQFPEPLSVGKLDVGNFAFSNAANTLQARNYLNYFQGGSGSVIYHLINC